KKKPSKKFRDEFGHTPVSIEEKIPWKCRRLIIGTGTGRLPVMDDLKSEAKRRKIALVVLTTTDAIEELKKNPDETNATVYLGAHYPSDVLAGVLEDCSLTRVEAVGDSITHSSVNGSLPDKCNSRFVFSFPQLRSCIGGVPASPQGSILGTFFQIPLSSIFL